MARILTLFIAFIWLACSSPEEITTGKETKATESSETVASLVPVSWNATIIGEFVSSKNSQISRCYDGIKIRYPEAGGTIIVKARLHPLGYVDSLIFTRDDINLAELQACIKKSIMAWQSPQVSPSNNPVWIEIPYEFSEYGKQVVTDSVRTETELYALMESKQSSLIPCFRGLSSGGQSLQTDIEITIRPNGRVAQVRFFNQSYTDETIDQCVENVIKTWLFRPVQSDKNQIFTVHFNLSQ